MYCQKCGTQNPDDVNFCNRCGNQFVLIEKPKSNYPYRAVGIISAIVSLLIFPPVFGILSIFCGYKVYRQDSEGWGIGIMVLGGIFMIIGMILGIYSGLNTQSTYSPTF